MVSAVYLDQCSSPCVEAVALRKLRDKLLTVSQLKTTTQAFLRSKVEVSTAQPVILQVEHCETRQKLDQALPHTLAIIWQW